MREQIGGEHVRFRLGHGQRSCVFGKARGDLDIRAPFFEENGRLQAIGAAHAMYKTVRLERCDDIRIVPRINKRSMAGRTF